MFSLDSLIHDASLYGPNHPSMFYIVALLPSSPVKVASSVGFFLTCPHILFSIFVCFPLLVLSVWVEVCRPGVCLGKEGWRQRCRAAQSQCGRRLHCQPWCFLRRGEIRDKGIGLVTSQDKFSYCPSLPMKNFNFGEMVQNLKCKLYHAHWKIRLVSYKYT